MSNEFNFFVDVDIPDDIYKAAKDAKGDEKYDNMIIYGLASDSGKDSEGEIMEPNGFQIDDFLKSGLINLEHFTTRKGDPAYWIGEPLEGYIKDNKFFVKAKLWKASQLARNFWDTCLIMKASGSTRKPGFSIEGKALERHPLNKMRVTKAKINHLAATFSPVNKNSYFDIVKGEQKEDFVKSEVENPKATNYMFEFEKSGKKYVVTKDFKVEEKKEELVKGLSFTPGTIREWGGKKYKKRFDGKWIEVHNNKTKEEYLRLLTQLDKDKKRLKKEQMNSISASRQLDSTIDRIKEIKKFVDKISTIPIELDDEEEKAVATESAKPLRRESLDKDVKNIIAKSLRSGRISPEKAYNLIKSFYI